MAGGRGADRTAGAPMTFGRPRGKPDVVVVMVDQLGAKWFEAALDGAIPAPNLRWLCERGTRFANAFTTNPVCSPARATIFTGLTGRGHGVIDCGYRLDPAVPTFVHALQRGGWRTGAFGKVHVIPQLEDASPDYRPYGFDVTAITEDARIGAWLDSVRREHPAHYDAALATVWMTMAPVLASDEGALAEIAAAQRAVHWSTSERPRPPGAYELPFPAAVSQTEWITERALSFLDTAASDGPLFAHVSYVQPHNPFCAPRELLERVDAGRIPPPLPAEWQADARAPTAFRNDLRGPAADDWQDVETARRLYFADLEHLDAQIGRLRAALEARGRLETTFIVFLSDHGELLFDHGFVTKFHRHYDAAIRIPLVIAGPGIAHGVVRDELVDLTDIAPTIHAMTGLAPPALARFDSERGGVVEDLPALPGRSLLALCSPEPAGAWRDAVYVESYGAYWVQRPEAWARTVRTARHRYTLYVGDRSEQLYDLVDDPGEQRNLAHDPAHRATRQELRDRLLELVVLQDWPHPPRDLYAVGGW